MKTVVQIRPVEQLIYLIRGQKVMLDTDLATLYGVRVKAFNQAVKRNIDRFPEDFMFQLSVKEATHLRSQIVTLKPARGRHRKYLPYAFTEQGVAMLSSVLQSKRAVRSNIAIMRAFVKLRKLVSNERELTGKLAELERKVVSHDDHIRSLFEAIRELMKPEAKGVQRIGFRDRSS